MKFKNLNVRRLFIEMYVIMLILTIVCSVGSFVIFNDNLIMMVTSILHCIIGILGGALIGMTYIFIRRESELETINDKQHID